MGGDVLQSECERRLFSELRAWSGRPWGPVEIEKRSHHRDPSRSRSLWFCSAKTDRTDSDLDVFIIGEASRWKSFTAASRARSGN